MRREEKNLLPGIPRPPLQVWYGFITKSPLYCHEHLKKLYLFLISTPIRYFSRYSSSSFYNTWWSPIQIPGWDLPDLGKSKHGALRPLMNPPDAALTLLSSGYLLTNSNFLLKDTRASSGSSDDLFKHGTFSEQQCVSVLGWSGRQLGLL